MARDVESLLLVMSADIRQLKRGMDEATGVFDRQARKMEKRQQELEKKFEKLGASLGDGLKKASLFASVAFGAIIGYSIKAAAEAVEMKNAFEVAFATGTKGAEEFAEALSKKVGRSQLEIQESMTRFRLLFKDQAPALADGLTEALQERAIDVGSLFNLKDADVVQKFFSGLTGEAEPLKALGVNLNEAALKAELLRLGFKGSAKEASEQAKQVARANIILRETALAQGDAAKTIDSTANSFKRLQGETRDAAARFGEQFLPIANKVMKWATDALEAFNKLPQSFQVAGLAALGLVAASGPLAKLAIGLSKIIQLAVETRAALLAIPAVSAAAGAAGGAAAAGGAVTAGAITAGGAVATVGATAATLALKGDTRAVSDLDAKIALEKSDRRAAEQFEKRGNFEFAAKLRAEADKTAESIAELRKSIAPKAGPPAAGAPGSAQTPPEFKLTGDLLKPIGGEDDKKGKPKGTKDDPITVETAKAISPLDPFTGKELPTFEERQIQELQDWLAPKPGEEVDGIDLRGLKPVDNSLNEAIEESRKLAAEAEKLWHDSVFDGILGGLEAASEHHLMDFLKDRLRRAIFEAAAEGLTQAYKIAGAAAAGSSSGIISGFAHLLGFAGGTRSAPGGLALVGEEGPEIVNLPRGSQVTTNGGLRAALAARAQTANVTMVDSRTFHLHAEGAVMTPELIAGLNSQMDQKAFNAGTRAANFALANMPGRLRQLQALGQ